MAVSNNFRDLLYPLDSPRLAGHRGMTAYEYGRAILDFPPAAELIAHWNKLASEPFKGVTSDGLTRQGLFALADEGAPVGAMERAAKDLMLALTDGERTKLMYRIDAAEWRYWSNPEFLIHPNGLRLEELSASTRESVLTVLRASMSPSGFEKARNCMRVNAFLGELCDIRSILNEWSYNFLIFGDPSATGPWGGASTAIIWRLTALPWGGRSSFHQPLWVRSRTSLIQGRRRA
jgi:hypothetical protein